jgi:hypothetical protein
MAMVVLRTRSSTPYRAGRRPLPVPPSTKRSFVGAGSCGACDRERGTRPAAPLAVLAALNDVPHRPSAAAFSVSPKAIRETNRHLPWARLAGVAVTPYSENRP